MVYPRPTEFLCVCFLEKLVGLPFALCDLSDLPRSACFCSQSRQPACLHLLALQLDPPDPFGPCPFAAACFSSSPLGLCSKKMSLRADRFFFYLDRSGGKSSAECGSQICEQKPGRMAGAFLACRSIPREGRCQSPGLAPAAASIVLAWLFFCF